MFTGTFLRRTFSSMDTTTFASAVFLVSTFIHPGDRVNIDDLQSSDITGTWPYMAPEIIKLTVGRRQEPYSIAVDYWSLGWIVYELESMTHKHRPMFKRYRNVIRYAAYQTIEVSYPPFEGMSEDVQSLLSGAGLF
ncbi:hypothetical protein H2248_012166 [Termitomyces sp. 'cryptogamus']|nr:hypothetical protein H2248_012166 [Termitomyces sp. 'cryptogamus']